MFIRVKYLIFLLLFSTYLIANNDYTINLIWINKVIQETQPAIFPEFDRNNSNISEKTRIWATKNPKAKLNFWYDSETTTPRQLENTKALLDQLKSFSESNNIPIAEVNLRDIRDFLRRYYPNTAQVFAANIPVYFRADLLRLMVSLEDVRSCQNVCFSVYTDVDVTPLSEGELFTDEVKDNLAKKGLVLKGDMGWFENSFHILSNQQPMMLKALQEAGVNVNIERTKLYLKSNPEFKKFFDMQYLYNPSLIAVFIYFYHLKEMLNLAVYDARTDDYISLLRDATDNSNRFLPDFNGDPNSYLKHLKIEVPTNEQNGVKIEYGIGFKSNYLSSWTQDNTYTIPTIKVEAPPIKYKYQE